MTTALLAALVTFVACPFVIRLLRRGDRLDRPNARSSHSVPTPRGGGLALLAAVASAAVAAGLTGSWSVSTWAAVAVVSALALVGFVDDVRGLPPTPRLVAQAVLGAAAGAALGGPAVALIGFLVVPAAVNMVNFMDGINGICAGHAAVWGAVAWVASSTLGGGEVLGVLAALSLGGALGFLPFNIPRARLFLGDVGSYLLGGLFGTGLLSALSATSGKPRSEVLTVLALVAAPYLLFAVDTATAIVRRARAGERLLHAHRSHVYQRLANERGVPHWVVSLAMAAAAAIVSTSFVVGWAAGLMVAVATASAYLLSPRIVPEVLSA